MFTGIIEAMTEVVKTHETNEIVTYTLKRPLGWELHTGQSIATDGVCLTVIRFDEHAFDVELMPETIRRSSFGTSQPQRVNLERAMSPESLFEGHIVQGHVDGVGEITTIEEGPEWRTLTVSYPPAGRGLLVEKGSITIDGISLTVVDVADGWLSVSLIPHTIAHTTLGAKKRGAAVNLEFDILGKYIAKQLEIRG